MRSGGPGTGVRRCRGWPARATLPGRVRRRPAPRGRSGRTSRRSDLEHPSEAGPTGAPSPDGVLAHARRPPYRASPPVGALRRYSVTADRGRDDRASLVRALLDAEPHPSAPQQAAGDHAPPRAAPPPQQRTVRRHVPSPVLAVLGVVATVGRIRTPPPRSRPRPPILRSASRRTWARSTRRWCPRLVGSTAGCRSGRRPRSAGRPCSACGPQGSSACLRAGGAGSGACRTLADLRADGLQIPCPTGSPPIGDVRSTPDGRLQRRG